MSEDDGLPPLGPSGNKISSDTSGGAAARSTAAALDLLDAFAAETLPPRLTQSLPRSSMTSRHAKRTRGFTSSDSASTFKRAM